ncbi:MAG: hypothetical protein J5775_07215 [Spirochaetales bacterium]|nr:hypothetical protein [Spirochaetales bacterium]
MAKNFKLFYALLKQHPEADKDALVMEFTDERTTSLREMSEAEFNALCSALQHGSGQGYNRAGMDRLKAARSAVLLRLGRLGINTVDNWNGIDQFCLSKKIAGKRFAQLDVDELKALTSKLEMIIRRGGVKVASSTESAAPSRPKAVAHILIPTNPKYLN